MKFSNAILSLVSLALLPSATLAQDECTDASALEIRGKNFYNKATGAYTPIKGLAYYPRPNDGINDANNLDFFNSRYSDIWQRDVAEFKELNINLIKLYAVDPSLDHDDFFCALRNAGIYVLIGLASDCANCAIINKESPDCYPGELKSRGEEIIRVFSKYSNVVGFSAGNEVALLSNAIKDPSYNAPCQKKFVRDMRAFVKNCMAEGMRHLPIGLSAPDLNIEDNANYYNCLTDSEDELEAVEWYGLNQYRYCDGSITDSSDIVGYQELLLTFKSLQIPVPVIFTEMGCVDKSFPTVDGYEGQRTFLDIETLFQEQYLREFAGGVVFEYSTEKALSAAPWPFNETLGGNFGVVYFSPEDCNDINIPCEVVRFPQFENLAERYGAVSVTEPANDESRSATTCPSGWGALADFTWESDSIDSLACPEKVEWDCPAPSGCTRAPTQAPGKSTSTSSNGSSGSTSTTDGESSSNGGSSSSSSGGSSSSSSGGSDESKGSSSGASSVSALTALALLLPVAFQLFA
jgi:1,3-beta-glucanosyltransferase GAS5